VPSCVCYGGAGPCMAPISRALEYSHRHHSAEPGIFLRHRMLLALCAATRGRTFVRCVAEHLLTAMEGGIRAYGCEFAYDVFGEVQRIATASSNGTPRCGLSAIAAVKIDIHRP